MCRAVDSGPNLHHVRAALNHCQLPGAAGCLRACTVCILLCNLRIDSSFAPGRRL